MSVVAMRYRLDCVLTALVPWKRARRPYHAHMQ